MSFAPLLSPPPSFASSSAVNSRLGWAVLFRAAMAFAMWLSFSMSFAYRSSDISPVLRAFSVRRRSALSCRSSSRYSAREVIILYGSLVPFVARSSTSTPIYASPRESMSGSSPLRYSPQFMPA